MIMDDQRHDTIAALGHPVVQTPTLDALVRRGTTFTQSTCTVPICTPARAEVMTGRSTFRNGVAWFNRPIDPSLTTLPKHFRDHGFHTCCVGKWHNDGHPSERGFDRTRRIMMSDNLLDYRQHGKELAFKEPTGEVRGHANELFADAAIEELDAAPDDRPWFMLLATISPHDPFDTPEPFASMYDHDVIPVPDNFMPEHPFDLGDNVIRDELLEPWPRTPRMIQRYLARYYGLISHHDHHLGRVIHHLERIGQLNNTVICFTSDHGLAVGSHGLLGKENMYDHSIRVPLIFAGPGVPDNTTSDALAHHVDLFPTLCNLANLPAPDTADEGVSLTDAMCGERVDNRDATLHAFCHPADHYPEATALTVDGDEDEHSQRALRTDRYKLTFFPHLDRYQLFDLEHDPDETHDLLVGWRWLAPAMGKTRSAWTRDPTHPLPTPGEARNLVSTLHDRMIELMRRQYDPALKLAEASSPRPPQSAST